MKEMELNLKLDGDEVCVLRRLIQEELERDEQTDYDTIDPYYDSDNTDELWHIRALLRLESKLNESLKIRNKCRSCGET